MNFKIFAIAISIVLYLIRQMMTKGAASIKKVQPKQKQWLDNRNKRMQLDVKKRNRKNKNRIRNTSQICSKQNRKKYTAVAPEIFSFIENPEETICFFENILIDTLKQTFDKTYFFDLSKVKVLTIDAVMYIIAILKDLKSSDLFRYKFEGNVPEEQKARTLLIESGFYLYVNSKLKNVRQINNKIQIITDKVIAMDKAKEICDFVNWTYSTERKFTQSLYPTLLELMENTIHHAYDNPLIATRWYMFVESKEDEETIQFIFLDTGEGIPTTINKKFKEKVANLLLFGKSDSEFISSALKGEFRTKTKKLNRGKGLPMIYDHANNKKLINLTVFSGSGSCCITENGEILQSNYQNKTFGTLFCWEISKNSRQEGKNDKN